LSPEQIAQLNLPPKAIRRLSQMRSKPKDRFNGRMPQA